MTPDNNSNLIDSETASIDPSTPPGAWLKRVRLGKGMQPEQVCGHLGITRHRLQMLEDDEYARLPAEVYVRGWIRRYCSMLDLSASALLASYEEQLALLQREKQARQQAAQRQRRQRTQQISAAAAVALIATAAIGWQLASATLNNPDAATSEAELQAEAGVTPKPVATMPPELLGDLASEEADSELSRLEVRFSSDSWVEVLDAEGNILVADLKNASEVLVLQGVPPFEVYVANAPAVQVRYRGEVLELAMTPGDLGVRTLVGTDAADSVSLSDDS